MLRFGNPIYLWLLLLIPLSVIVYLCSVRKYKQQLVKFRNPTLIHQLSSVTSKKRGWVGFVLVELVLLLLVLIITRPQAESKIATNKGREGIETIIALDISNSMLTEDITPSRLGKNKLIVESLMNKFNEDKIGLTVFAGDAFVQLPITSDYVSAKVFLDNINPSLIGTQGADIGKTSQFSMNGFTPSSKVGKAIILITDGEDNEGGTEEMAKQTQSKRIRVFILGVGSAEGATVPMPDDSELRTSNGEVVKTRLSEEICKQIVAAGHGIYLHVTNSSMAGAVLDRKLNKLQRGKISNVVYGDFNERFQTLALLVIILLIIDVLLLGRKRRW